MNPKARISRFQRIGSIGCLCCRRYGYFGVLGDVHHLNLGQHAGQKRLGDEHTIGLCAYHHRGILGGQSQEWWERQVGPSLALKPKEFREKFGSDLELLAEQNELIEEAEKRVVGAA
jgi:hypothetical protein